MRLFVLLLLTASPLFACCPKDTDTLAEEVGDDLQVLDVIAGQVPRYLPAWYEAKLKAAEVPLERAEWLDQLNRQEAALDELAHESAEDQGQNVRKMRFRLALHLWWRGGAGKYTPERCLQVARQARESEPANPFFDRLLIWMELDNRAEAGRIHPDMFNLRMMPNKKSGVATGQLAEAGLQDLDRRLIALIKLHPVWENFDTFHSLAIAYAVEGKQNLAQYARFRAWELHDAGKLSRVPGTETLEDIRAATLVRERIGGVHRPVQLVTDENLERVEAQFKARRKYAEAWNTAVSEHAAKSLGGGMPPTEFTTWEGFEPPERIIPPLYTPPKPEQASDSTPAGRPGEQGAPKQAEESTPAAPESNADGEPSRGNTWIMLGVLVGILLAGLYAKSRIDRSARTVVENAEKHGDES